MSEATSKENSLVLNHPFNLGKLEPVKVLNFAPVKGKHLRTFNMNNPTMDDFLQLAEKLTCQTTTFFDEMDGSDIINVVEKVGKLLEGSQKTGN